MDIGHTQPVLKHGRREQRIGTEESWSDDQAVELVGNDCGEVKPNQNFKTTENTMTIISTVGTSFIIRKPRPVTVFSPVAKSFRLKASQW